MMNQETTKNSSFRPPIVAVLGHVDHGKTTLLDFIRKTNVAGGESGGITQHIGAYQIEVKSQKSKVKSDEIRLITFIDTPGHLAFAKMRCRGVQVADIAVLVVACNDSVKPQTLESIAQIKAADIPFIVAANKIDLPSANLDRVKQDLAKAGVGVEGFGGDVPLVSLSAKTGVGVDELLDLILLISQMKGPTSEPKGGVEAVVVETRVDKGKGIVATLIVKKGTLVQGMTLYEEEKQILKVRAMFDENGKAVFDAPPSCPVEVLGFNKAPSVGLLLTEKPVVLPPKKIADKHELPILLPDFLSFEPEPQKLKILLKADTAGSLEAIIGSLDPKITVVARGVGDVSQADVLLAKGSGALIIGFNVEVKPPIEKLAQIEKVIVRIYKVIYELLEELSEVVLGLKEVLGKERELGAGQIIAQFPFDKQQIAGTKIVSGRLARGDTVKVVREEKEITRVRIKSLHRGKEDITKAEAGLECGVLFDRQVDFNLGDAIIAVTTN